MKSQQPLIVLDKVSKRYGYVDALKSIDLSIYPDEIVSIVGDNGAGKSTLINMMCGLEHPTEGSITVHGYDETINDLRHANSMGIAAVFQHPEFCENLDVAANLFLGNEIRKNSGIRDDESMTIKAREVLNDLASAVRVGQPIAALSGGQREMVAIARSLLSDPKLMLLDEPTASLSAMQTGEILDYLRSIRMQGCSIVMVCHNLPDVFAISDRIIVMRHGRIVGEHLVSETSFEKILGQMAGIGVDEQRSNKPRTPRSRCTRTPIPQAA